MAANILKFWKRGALVAVVLVCVAGFLLYQNRFQITRNIIDHELKKRGLRASYSLSQLDTGQQRLDHIVLGDPQHPDLVADSIILTTTFASGTVHISSLTLSGARLHAVMDKNGTVHLGSLDRLRSQSSGPATFPDLNIMLKDARIALDTPYGPIMINAQGQGNPAHDFNAMLALAAGHLGAKSCSLDQAQAHIAVKLSDGKINLNGPLSGALLGCGPHRLQGVSAKLDALIPQDLSGAQGHIYISSRQLATPYLRQATQGLDRLKGTLAAGWGADFQRALRGLGAGMSADASFAANRRDGLLLSGMSVQTASGAQLQFGAPGFLALTPASGPLLNGTVLLTGAGLPLTRAIFTGALNRFSGTATLAPESVNGTRLRLAPISFAVAGARISFASSLRLDGALGAARFVNLSVPLKAHYGATGITLDTPCLPVSVDSLQAGSLNLGRNTVGVCLRGSLVTLANPALHGTLGGTPYAFSAQQIAYSLTGKTAHIDQARLMMGGGSPIDLHARTADYALGTQHFGASDISAVTGVTGHQSRVHIVQVSGSGADGSLRGDYGGADGSIVNLPLLLNHSSGTW
ncbi:MAG: hypothetical protein KGQ42_03565, partial [Alphaproteobacteria bacterium]|nr:hypothetical protein [Alphaproteobacteria bacterium]